LGKRYGLAYSIIRRWVKGYEQRGLKALRKKSSRYSAPFKLSVLQHMWREELSAIQTATLFDIRGGAGVIRTWGCQYHEGGLEALMPKPRGHTKQMEHSKPPKRSKPPEPSPLPATDTPTLEALRRENAYLRAEVAYLKKLRALLQAKEQAAQKKRGSCLN